MNKSGGEETGQSESAVSDEGENERGEQPQRAGLYRTRPSSTT